jgi:hypothetical protein
MRTAAERDPSTAAGAQLTVSTTRIPVGSIAWITSGAPWADITRSAVTIGMPPFGWMAIRTCRASRAAHFRSWYPRSTSMATTTSGGAG